MVGISAKKQRSHSGCSRCKRRRQKCDETKPQCGRCTEARVSCEYSVQLRWGGRDFDRSRFGHCLKGSVRKVRGDRNMTDGFVYAATTLIPLVSHDLPLFPSLSSIERLLLGHFVREASRITCCHSHVQTELLQLILPMAVESQSLMGATLAWAAIHSVAFRGQIEGVTDAGQLIASLKSKSLESLRRELGSPTLGNSEVLLATVRTLCQCEIHSGSDESSVWRVHVRGAKALMAVIGRSQPRRVPISRLLYRWCASLDSLATLAFLGNSTQVEEDINTSTLIDVSGGAPVYLDDYNGYSTDLSAVIGEIGIAVAARPPNETLESYIHLELQADSLESTVFEIMKRDNDSEPVFYPGVVEKLSSQAIREYRLCNEAYQHTALVHIRRRLRRLPQDDPSVQYSVRRIIECVQSITPSYGLSPGIVLTTPLFTAGCEAFGEDRETIRQLLTQLYDLLKIRNINLAMEVLEAYWGDDTNSDWETFLRQRNWDFIPY